MKSKFTLLKFYLTVVSLVGVIGLAVGYGVAIYNGIESIVISNDEYLIGSNRSYVLDQCTQPKYAPVADAKPETPTDEEVATCKEEAKQDIILQRQYVMKHNIIGGLVWGTLALILFLIHYPMLIKKSKEELD